MPDRNGSVYGLTILSPILNETRATPSHDLQIRRYLATLPTGEESPFALAPGTHLARLVVMDDVIFVGSPALEEHLNSKYLIFETNCDSDVDEYFSGLAKSVPQHIDAIWKHCVGFPGIADVNKVVAYFKSCRIVTSFFFAAVNDKSLPVTLRALQTQSWVADFIATHQGMEPKQLQAEFKQFVADLKAKPIPKPGAIKAGMGSPEREIKTGGHNE